jgi:hypothetical protein
MKNKKVFIPEAVTTQLKTGMQLIVRKDSEGFWAIFDGVHARGDNLQEAIEKLDARLRK